MVGPARARLRAPPRRGDPSQGLARGLRDALRSNISGLGRGVAIGVGLALINAGYARGMLAARHTA